MPVRRFSLEADAPRFDAGFIRMLNNHLNEWDSIEYEAQHESYTFPDTYWFIGPENDLGNAELRIALREDAVVISRVLFTHRRQGIMTKLFKFLQSMSPLLCNRIRIESVSTPEMAAWCIKNGFQVVHSTAFECEGITLGDYTRLL